jgi:cell wall-associated NlpC family hydrolase
MRKLLIISMFFIACNEHKKEDTVEIAEIDTFNVTEDKSVKNVKYSSKEIEYSPEEKKIHTGNTTPGELLSYAESLIGVPYKYGSTDPREGFDCSGFITHVFNHFNINVPRSSIDFTNVKREIPAEQAKAGDIVLFTGTDSTIRDVGHMGIITSNENNVINFIHSTSGKANGVTITPLNTYYMGRFVKVIRIFPQNI